jgi:hypothetical protein
MTKQEALKQIEELKKFIEGEDRKNVVNQFPTKEVPEFQINGRRAGALFAKEEQGTGYVGEGVSSHNASLYLASSHGTWYTQDGGYIGGYLYFKPNN